MKRRVFGLFQDLKLTQKIFAIFIILLFLIVNSWGFTLTTVLDFRDSFSDVETYAFPSVIATSNLKDQVHIALLSVYNYVNTGDPASKVGYQDHFTNAITYEYDLFQLSQTSNDFEFTQQFNEKLLAVYAAADTLVATYEQDPNSQDVATQLQELNILRDEFNDFLETEITNQVSYQIESVNQSIKSTVKQIQYYLIGVAGIVIVIIIFLVVFISNNLRKPLEILTQAAVQFGKGNFKKVNIQRKDELGLFAETFNTMAQNIEETQFALREELEKTKKLDRQKSEFLSIAAHQLRTPMAGIRWATQMIYDGDMGDLNEDQKHHLGRGIDNINRMIKLINDLLDVTKIEEQKFSYNFERKDFRDIVHMAIDGLIDQAKEKSITVQSSFTPDEPLQADVDAEKMLLALNNLLDNAIKYSQKESVVEVTVSINNATLTCAIQDHGIGIPSESQPEVFTKFFRAGNAMKMFADGSGLGLFIVKDIVSKHDGSITFTSNETEGTTFTFTLPVTHKATPAELKARAMAEPISKAQETAAVDSE